MSNPDRIKELEQEIANLEGYYAVIEGLYKKQIAELLEVLRPFAESTPMG